MAVKIEKGGWALIFLIGLCLVGYSLAKYGVVNVRGWSGSKSRAAANAPAIDTSKPLLIPASSGDSCSGNVRVRVNIWVGCAAGLVANGGLDTVAGSIYDKKGLKSASRS